VHDASGAPTGRALRGQGATRVALFGDSAMPSRRRGGSRWGNAVVAWGGGAVAHHPRWLTAVGPRPPQRVAAGAVQVGPEFEVGVHERALTVFRPLGSIWSKTDKLPSIVP